MTQEHFDTIPAINLDDVTGGGYANGYAISQSLQRHLEQGGKLNPPPAPTPRFYDCAGNRCVPRS